MSRKTVIIIISLSVLVATILIAMSISNKPEDTKKKSTNNIKAKYVNTIMAEYKSYNTEVYALGRVNSFEQVDLYSEVQGTLNEISKNFKVGNKFRKGETIISINSEKSELDLKSAKSKFHSLLTSLMPDIKNDYSKYFDAWIKYLNNFNIDNKLQNLPEYDDKLKFYLSNKNVFNSFYEIQNLELTLSKHKIIAPFDGVITESMIDKGGLIRPNQKLGQISSVNNFELELSVDANDLDLVQIGNKVEVFNEKDEKITDGKVVRIAGNIDLNTQTVKVFISINSSKVKDGMYLKGKIPGIELEKVVKIDRSALVNNKFIYIINNGKLDKSEIEIIRFDNSVAYIKGIAENTEIVNEPLANVQLGANIKSSSELK